ncbi:adenine nucleotide alpha hydrolase family protein [Myroides pelagicus]|uniref:hypothetical protein n=1 Tax=Myroides pelagicus TaxID=270914 RepID=UPI002DB5F47A|nr:hypothetical protein [Myroides pelagicus]MEC4112670.1 hypothetical protein [Myroides pelagicus]
MNTALFSTKAASVIAKKLKAEIILLHVLDLPQQASDSINKGTPATEVMFFKNAAEDKLKELAHDPIFNGLTVSSSLILDRTSLGVSKSAENNKSYTQQSTAFDYNHTKLQ